MHINKNLEILLKKCRKIEEDNKVKEVINGFWSLHTILQATGTQHLSKKTVILGYSCRSLVNYEL